MNIIKFSTAIIFAMIGLTTVKSYGQVLWSSSGGSAWLTGSNWTGGSYPSSSQIAQFGANPTAATGVGINFSNTTNAGTQTNGSRIQDMGAIEVTSARAAAFLVGNSTTTAGATGTLRLYGITVNSQSNVILRNNSSQLFTIQNTQGSGSLTMGLSLNNATNNNIYIDGTGGITISSIIGQNASGYNLSLLGSGTGALTLSAANTFTGGVTMASGTKLNINNASALGTTAGTFTINGGAINNTSGSSITTSNYPITIGGNFSFTGSNALNLGTGNTALGTATRTITNFGVNNLTLGGVISGGTGGALTTNCDTTGNIILTGVNTYTGGTTIDGRGAGQLQIGAVGALPTSGTVTVTNGGGLRINITGTHGGSSQSFVFSPNQTTNPSLDCGNFSATLQGNLSLNATTRVEANGASSALTLSGNITGTGMLLKQAAGNLILSGTGNTYSGGTTVGLGTLTVNSGSAISTGSLILNQYGAASTVTLNNTSQTISSLASNFFISTGTFANTINLGSGHTLTINQSTNTTYGPGAVSTLTSVLAGSGNIVKSGTGTLTLSGTNNTYTGSTTINAGTISVSTLANGGSNSGIGASTNAATNLVLGGGVLQYTGATVSTDRNFTLTAATADTIDVSTNTLTITGASTATSGSLTKTGAGTLVLTGANLYTGSTTVSAGTLQLNKSGGTTITATNNITVNGGTLQISTNQTVNNLTISSGTLTVDAGVTLTINGTLTYTGGTISSTGTIVYGGSGALSIGASKTTGIEWTASNTPASVTITAGTYTLANAATTSGDLTVSGTAQIVGTGFTLTAGGNWSVATSSGYTGGTNASSVVILNGTGSKTFAHTGGATFRNLTISGTGTYTSSNDINISVNTLTISNGGLDMGTNSLNGTGNLSMSGGTLTLAKTGVNLPEFTNGTNANSITGGTIVLNGAGSQTLKGATYNNLTFGNSGTKNFTSSVSLNNPATVTVNNTATLDVSNTGLGGAGTNLTLNNTATYRTSGTGTKPDAQGTYTLAAGSTVEFYNNAGSQQDIRLAPTYGNIDISGTNVGLSGTSSSLTLQSGSIFTVKNGGIFNVINTNGFAGVSNSAISNANTPTISLPTGSTINFSGSSAQNINARTFSKVYINGGSTKTLTGDVTVSDSLKIVSGKIAIAGNTLTLAGIITSDTTNSLVGSNTSKLSITTTGNANTIYLDQTTSADATTTIGTNALLNLVLNGTSGSVTLGKKINLFGRLSVKNSTLNTNDVLVLRSVSSNTAYVDSVGGTISGQVTVERYIHKQARGWRAITAPVTFNGIISNDNDKVYKNWQSNFGYSSYGTRITGPTANTASNGLDDITSGSSLQTYNSTTGAWTKVANTKTETQSGSTSTAANKGFFMFIRGDRTVTPAGSTPNTFATTTLATKGLLQTGTQTFNFTGTANKSWLIGNPYAAPVQMDSVTFNNIGNFVYVWDAHRTGISANTNGNYVTFDRSAWNSGPSVGTTNKYFQSGQAFFVVPTSATASITFNERNKTTATNNNTQVTGAANSLNDIFNVKLYSINADATKNEIDGVRVKYGANYSKDVDADDAAKWAGAEIENLSLTRNTKQLSIEARPYIVGSDSLFLNLTNLNVGANYEFKINPINFDATVSSCKLYDNFLNTATEIDLNNNTLASFSTTNIAASSAANRFYIVFNGAGSLACSTLVAKAYKKNNNVVIDWNTTCESNLKTYEVEKSVDGRNFIKIANESPKNSSTTATYSSTDNNAVNDINYYRVKAVQANGSYVYSNTVFVKSTTASNGNMVIFPNPSTGVFNIAISNKSRVEQATIEITNLFGKIVKTYNVANNNGNINFTVNATDLSNGLYFVKYEAGTEKGAVKLTINK